MKAKLMVVRGRCMISIGLRVLVKDDADIHITCHGGI